MIRVRKVWAFLVVMALASIGVGAILTLPANAENLNTPTTITVGTASRAINGVNVARGTDQTILYSSDFGTNTGTNQWGVEAVVHCTGSPLSCVVQSVRDRQPTQDLTPTTIPAKPDYVLSTHGVSADWARANVTVGKAVTLKDSGGVQTFWPGSAVTSSTTATGTSVSPSATCTATGTFLLGISDNSGSNGNGVADEQAWQANHAIRLVGTWSDDDSNSIYHLSTDLASWTGSVDIAVGGLWAGQTWSAASAGSYNAQWTTKINNLKAAWGSRPAGNLYVRFAHEFNGDFSSYYANDANAANFVSAFRRWSTLLQTNFPGAHPVWSPNDGSNVTNIDNFWPGNDKVDLIAVDHYNAWPHYTTAAEVTSHLSDKDSNNNPVQPEAWRQYALSKSVPMGFGEIGNPSNSAAAGGGGDAPGFFDAMESWSEAHAGTAAGQVAYAAWFNAGGYTAHYQFYIDAQGADPTQPNFAARFQQAPVVNAGSSCATSPPPTSLTTSVSPTSSTTSVSPTSSTTSVSPTGTTCAPNSTVTQTVTVTAPAGTTTSPPPTSVTTTPPPTSVTTTPPVNGAYPAQEVAGYQMLWSSDHDVLGSLPAQVNVVRLAFFNDGGTSPGGASPGIVGYTDAGKATMFSQLRAFVNRGGKVTLSLGGGGQTLSLANPTNVVNRIKAVMTDLSDAQGTVITGIDWDIESGDFTDAGVFSVSQQLVQAFGANFAITMVPNGGNIGTYLPTAKRLNTAGYLTSFGQQFYDAPMTYSAIDGRVNEYLSNGLPISKYAVGMMIGTDSSHPTEATYNSWFIQLQQAHPGLDRAYLWELSRPGTAQWAADMAANEAAR